MPGPAHDRWCRHLDVQEAKVLAEAVSGPSISPKLLAIELTNVPALDDVYAALLFSMRLPTLQSVTLWACGLGAAGAEALAAAVTGGACDSLRLLWLDKNHIGDQGVAAIAPPLSRLRSLEWLPLDANGLRNASLAMMAYPTEHPHPWPSLYVSSFSNRPDTPAGSRNVFSDNGVMVLCGAVDAEGSFLMLSRISMFNCPGVSLEAQENLAAAVEAKDQLDIGQDPDMPDMPWEESDTETDV